MIGLAVPFEDTLVKNPPNCPLETVPPPMEVNFGLGEVCSYHTTT